MGGDEMEMNRKDKTLSDEELCRDPRAMRTALEWANAPSARQAHAGFRLVASLAENLPEDTPGELGFFDHFLFLARKAATHEDPDVRRAVSSALAALASRSPNWREAVVETCEEIADQPSSVAEQLASQVLNDLKEREHD